MDNPKKAHSIERVLLALLFCALSAGGYAYGQFKDEMPGLQLPLIISAGYGVAYAIYRVAHRLLLRNTR